MPHIELGHCTVSRLIPHFGLIKWNHSHPFPAIPTSQAIIMLIIYINLSATGIDPPANPVTATSARLGQAPAALLSEFLNLQYNNHSRYVVCLLFIYPVLNSCQPNLAVS